MQFKDLVPLNLYRGQALCPVPKGSPTGYGEAIILLTPSTEDSMKLLEQGTYLGYNLGLFRSFYLETAMYEKIGNRMIRQKMSQQELASLDEHDFAYSMHLIRRGAVTAFIKKKKNIFIDMGQWNDKYFSYQKKISPLRMAQSYVDFLVRKLKMSDWKVYHQTMFIDLNQWSRILNHKIIFEADRFNNPLTMILFLLYKNSISLEDLQDFDYVFFNSDSKAFMYVDGNSLTNENYQKIKTRLSTMMKADLDIEDIQNITVKDEEALISSALSDKDAETIRLAKIRSQLQSNLSKEFLGQDDDEDTTADEIDGRLPDEEQDQDNDEPIQFTVADPDLASEIEKFVDDIMNSTDNIDTLEKKANDKTVLRETADKVSKNVHVNAFLPEYTKAEIARIEKLESGQNKVIPKITSEKKAQSKIIDEIDVSHAVKVVNKEMTHIKFSNFDHSYNKKKLEMDIDSAITGLNNGSRKVFVTGKEVVDSSDQLNSKETRTYHLEDDQGKRMTVKFDIPKIYDGRYIHVNGNKKILSHQLIAKPLIKNKPDEVKFTTWYNKLIIDRKGREDTDTAPLIKHLIKNAERFRVRVGNGYRKNGEYLSSLEFSVAAKRIYSFMLGDYHFITAIDEMVAFIKKKGGDPKVTKTRYPIAFNPKTKDIIYLNAEDKTDSYADKLWKIFNENYSDTVPFNPPNSRLFRTEVKILDKQIPLPIIILHTVGLTEMLRMAKVENEWIDKEDKSLLRNYDSKIWGRLDLADGWLMWKREPMEVSLLMNGMTQKAKFNSFTREEMDSKDTYIHIMGAFYNFSNMSYNLDQYANFMIDDVTKEICEDLHLPTTYCELLLEANKMLCTTDFILETDIRNLRLRSNELLPRCIYKAVTTAYGNYRKSWQRRHPVPITIKQDAVMKAIMDSTLTEDESILNPFLEMEKARSVTVRSGVKGDGGIGMTRALTLQKRAYNESMLGVLGITTSADANVGIARELTVEPIVTSTRGYIDYQGKKNVEDLTSRNLLTAGEMLLPMGIEHDDPVRSAMAVKQSKYMIPIDESEPGMISNGFDKVLPYHMGKEFVVKAEDDGVVVEEKENLIIVKYNNGRYQSVDTSEKVRKNGSAGFWIVTHMLCNKHKGDKVSKDEVIGWEQQAFQKDSDDLSATMTRGPFVKIAMIPRWDCYEDSTPMTSKASNSMASTMGMEEIFSFSPTTVIKSIKQVGDLVSTGDALIEYDEFGDDSDVQELMSTMYGKLKQYGDEFISSASTVKKAKHGGQIADIKIYSTVTLDEMSPSMRGVVEAYYNKLNAKINILKKYKNPEDDNYLMAGQRITEFPEPIEPDKRGRLKGELVGDGGVVFCFYIKFKDYIKKGDKITCEYALKGVTSQVIAPGLEPYSELRPDEEIGLIIAPHSPMARKTTGVFKTMFINKLLIERKRQITDYWKQVRPLIKV